MNKRPKPVNRKNLFRRFAGVDELDFVYPGTGEKIKRFVITRPDAAAILIYNKDSDSFVFIRQFRAPVYTKDQDGFMLEIPAGVIEPGETPEQCIIRECIEETGYEIKKPRLLNMIYPSCGLLNERIYLFYHEVADRDKIASGGGLSSEHEYLDIVEFPVRTVFEMVKKQQITDGKTLSALLHYKNDILS